MERNIFGEYRRSTVERPLTDGQQAKRDRDVARVMSAAKRLHGPAHDANEVVWQRMYLVKSGLMPASQLFAPRMFRPSR
jgi:hypothetical protein